MTTLALPRPQLEAPVRPIHAIRRHRAEGRWAQALYVVLLILQFFRTNAEERWLARLLPVAALLILLARPRGEILTRRLPITILAFGVWCLLSLLWTVDPSGSPIVLLDLWSSLFVAWCCGALLPLPVLRGLLSDVAKVVCLVTVAFLVLLPGLSTRPSPEDGAPGWHGPFDHKNGLGAFLVLAIVTFVFDRTTHARKVGWLALCAVLLVGSQSSSAVALVVVAASVLLWQRGVQHVRSLWRRTALAGIAMAGLLVGVFGAVTDAGGLTSVLGRNATFSGRTLIWHVVIERIHERPWIGWGYGGMWRPSSLPSQQMWREMRFHAYHAHDGYLDLLLQVGVVGAVLFLSLLLVSVVRFWRRRSNAMALWAFLVLLTIALNAATESGPFFEGIAVVALLATSAVAVARTHPDGRLQGDAPTTNEVLPGRLT